MMSESIETESRRLTPSGVIGRDDGSVFRRHVLRGRDGSCGDCMPIGTDRNGLHS